MFTLTLNIVIYLAVYYSETYNYSNGFCVRLLCPHCVLRISEYTPDMQI